MALMLADDLHLYFGPRRIFSGDNLAVEPGDRLGLVGPNGSGKSTLLKILAGTTQPDAGTITRSKGLRVGYLPQELGETSDAPLRESVLKTAPGKAELEHRIQDIEDFLAKAQETQEQMQLAEQLADLHTELAELDTYYGPHRAEAILHGLGFGIEDLTKPLRAFSGGWRMRAALASLLYQRPDILLLDEPTNHLDLPSVYWLSNYLKSIRHAIILTCHDREFLNRHVSRVISLELDGLKSFRGNYDEYREQRTIQLAHIEARIENEAERKRHLEAFVDRFKAKASKARQAQSRVKMIEKMEADRIDLPEVRRALHIRFPEVPRSADRVLSIQQMTFGYQAEHQLFSDVELEVRRGERIAVVGVNGAGKTTLLRLIAEELEPLEGRIELGRGVLASYFAQHHSEALTLNRTILEEVRSAAPERSETEIRSICGAVLFTGDDVNKPVAVLSGGEKARVAMARMLIRPANLLLLDEPTNHLDTDSAEILTESLQKFEGTILFVSHNLDFARRLSTRVWDVSKGQVENFSGDLQEYLNQLETHQEDLQNTFGAHALEHQASRPQLSRTTDEKAFITSVDKEARIAARTHRKKAEAEERRRKKNIENAVLQAELEVSRLETEKSIAEQALSAPDIITNAQALKEASEYFTKISEALETALEQWAEAEAARENETASS
ncbi:MAG: ATP-binding cassette domain-containing protein [Myxococcales bacterium]|nr:ATP-binding cassette domain-containing protein [Myxococcales bacterium]